MVLQEQVDRFADLTRTHHTPIESSGKCRDAHYCLDVSHQIVESNEGQFGFKMCILAEMPKYCRQIGRITVIQRWYTFAYDYSLHGSFLGYNKHPLNLVSKFRDRADCSELEMRAVHNNRI